MAPVREGFWQGVVVFCMSAPDRSKREYRSAKREGGHHEAG